MKSLALSLLMVLPLSAELSIKEAFQISATDGMQSQVLPAGGASIALKGDVLAAGHPGFFTDSNGWVNVYQRVNGIWEYRQSINAPDDQERWRFGISIDLSEDGNTLVVGSADDYTNVPREFVSSGAYVYQRHPVSGLFSLVQKLVPATSAWGDQTGTDVAISGNWIAIGSPEDDDAGTNEGAVFLFQRDAGSSRWVERQKVLPPAGYFGNNFGRELDLSGNNLAIGAESSDPYLMVYHRNASTNAWVYEFGLVPQDTASHNIAPFLSGDRLIEHRQCCDDRIAVHQRSGVDGVPNPNPGTWTQVGPNLGAHDVPPGGLALDGDYAVRVDGNQLVVQCFDGSNWQQVGAVTPPPSFGRGGTGAAIDGNTIALSEDVGPEISSYRVTVFSPSPVELLARVKGLLFHDDAPGDPAEAAFAYQTLFYQDDGLGSFLARHSEIDTLYGPVNEANADTAEALLRSAYPGTSGNTATQLEALFLDLAYGRAAAQLIRSKETLRQLNKDRLEVIVDLFLDTEIATVQTALDQAAAGLNEYFTLLQDSLGVPPVNGNPAGRALFAKLVPGRALVSPIDTDADPDSDPDILLTGYKDLVLLYDLLQQHARTAADLAFLLTARDTPADAQTVRNLIGDTQRLVFEQRLLLDALFPALTAGERDTLGLTELSNGIAAALNDLSAFEQNLNGTINLLNYEPDFLMLIQNQGGLFDSFDSFKAILDENNSPLNTAKNNRIAALAAIDSYGSKQDDLEAEFSLLATNSTSALIPRLTEIVGVPIGLPGYDTPQDNEGSEIWQQVQSIEAARLRIQRNSAEISNLHEKIRIENERRATEAGINADLSENIIEWGDQQASMTEEIGRIEAAQAAADALTELFEIENITKLITGVGVVNAAVQAGGEIGKANLEASKERLAATQEAAIRDADDAILDNNSQALVKNILLEMNTLLIDSQEAVILLRQEAGRLTGLLCEKADLERRLAEVNTQLAARYFADPVHRLRALNTTELATISFRNARQWLFFAARALEYKWNTPFALPANFSSDGRAWNLGELFKLRNAHELDRFYTALCDWDTLVGNNRTFVQFDDWFSLREDYFGYELNDDLTGDPLFYDVINPNTGEIENVDAIVAFRYELQRLTENCDDDPLEEICLRFDTVRRNDFDTVTGQFQDTFFSDSNYLDRIDDLRIFVRGPHQNLDANDSENTISAELSYFGSSIIRNETSGTVSDPARPDLVSGEFTSYPNRFYRFFASGYRFEEGLTFKSGEALKVLPTRSRATLEAAPTPQAIDAFRERSVATTSWLLNLQLNPGVNPGARLVIDEIDDIELFINHKAVQR